MKSLINIFNLRGRSLRPRSSIAVSIGYFWNSSDMSYWNTSDRGCQFFSN